MNTPKNEPNHCPRCGAPLAGNTARGLCPKCVLAAGFETHSPTAPIDEAGPPDAHVPLLTELAPHFPQLEILELLGRGGMGCVYKARQKNLDRLVALKILPPAVGRDPAFAERFNREARVLARLNHPNIVAIYDFGQAGPYFYFLMEFVDGANLRQIERSRRLSPEEAFALVPRICEALQFAHDEGIVHRDIKPENILVDARGRVKIADFGIARIVGPGQDITLTGTQQTLGTPHYMAPEQVATPARVDHRADIYALGVVFYEMLTGELPLGRFEPPSKRLEVDVRVDEVVLKSLERNPERRYQTVTAVKTDVEAISQGAGTPATPVAPSRQEMPTQPASESAGKRLDAPAYALATALVVNWLHLVWFGLIAFNHTNRMYVASFLVVAAGLALATWGSVQLFTRGSWRWARAAAILVPATSLVMSLASIALFWTLIALPIGIWSLATLAQPAVRASFAVPGTAAGGQSPWSLAGGWLVWLLVPVAFLTLGGRFDAWIPFEGPAFDAAKLVVFCACLGFLIWYFRGRRSSAGDARPDAAATGVQRGPAGDPYPKPEGHGDAEVLVPLFGVPLASILIGVAIWWTRSAIPLWGLLLVGWLARLVPRHLEVSRLAGILALISAGILLELTRRWQEPFDAGEMGMIAILVIAGMVYFGYRHFRTDDAGARAETGSPQIAEPASPSAEPGAFSVLGQAWRNWWSERSKWFAISVQCLLVIGHLACMAGFFSVSITRHQEPGGPAQFTYSVGAFDPWYRYETWPAPNTPFRFGPDFISGSMLFLVVGFALYYAVWRIEKARKPTAGWWSSPAPMAILWALWAVLAVSMGTMLERQTSRVPGPRRGAESAPAVAPATASPPAAPAPGEDLVAACARGDMTRVGQLLDARHSVNDKNAAGQTPLLAAAANGHRSLALTLLLLGADLTAQDTNGMTALMHAVERRDRTFIAMLPRLYQLSYEQDAAKRKETLRGLPGVDRALLQDRDFDLVQFSAWNDAIEQTDARGETPALKAARTGDWETCQLVAITVDSLRSRGHDGRTLAMWFAAIGTKAPFQRLEQFLFGKAGAEAGFTGEMLSFDVDQLALSDRDGQTALQLARAGGHQEIADILTRHLQTLVADETRLLERLARGEMTDAEAARELSYAVDIFAGQEPARKRQLLDSMRRRHHERRGQAWQALGETEQATRDYETSRRRGP
jgi:ankyrin repeat protein/predicted Ser/Thr protein kinase